MQPRSTNHQENQILLPYHRSSQSQDRTKQPMRRYQVHFQNTQQRKGAGREPIGCARKMVPGLTTDSAESISVAQQHQDSKKPKPNREEEEPRLGKSHSIFFRGQEEEPRLLKKREEEKPHTVAANGRRRGAQDANASIATPLRNRRHARAHPGPHTYSWDLGLESLTDRSDL